MKKSREIVGLPVIELQEGYSLGRVVSLLVNRIHRHVEALEVGERTLLKTKTEVIPFTKLHRIGDDAITVNTADAKQKSKTDSETTIFSENLLNTQAITADGKFLGNIEEFSFNPEDGALSEIFIVTEKTHTHLALPVATIKTFGRDFIIINEDYQTHAQEVDLAAFHTTFVKTLENKAVDFALERAVKQDVVDEGGDIIIQKGEKVTTETITLARQKGRLPQLLFAAGVGELLDGIDFTREKLDAGSKKLMEAWHRLRGRSQDWLNRKLDDDMTGTTAELRDLWQQVQSKLIQGSREIEEVTRARIHTFVLDKKLSNPVYDQDGALLAGRNDVVTAEIIAKAEEAGRLPQLFLSASANEVQGALDPVVKQIRHILGEK